jgi:hypothetical protein
MTGLLLPTRPTNRLATAVFPGEFPNSAMFELPPTRGGTSYFESDGLPARFKVRSILAGSLACDSTCLSSVITLDILRMLQTFIQAIHEAIHETFHEFRGIRAGGGLSLRHCCVAGVAE